MVSRGKRRLQRPLDGMIRQLRRELSDGLARVGNSQSPFVRRLAARYSRSYLRARPADLLPACRALMMSRDTWEQMIACAWLEDHRASLGSDCFCTFERWLRHYVFSWGTCDDYCKRVLNPFFEADLGLFSRICTWTRARGTWVRRASAVVFIKSEGGGYGVTIPTRYVFAIADRLMMDRDMHVQKGYGWMLKAASIHHGKEVYAYVMRNRHRMPRTAFRYAIEKLPIRLRERAMRA